MNFLGFVRSLSTSLSAPHTWRVCFFVACVLLLLWCIGPVILIAWYLQRRATSSWWLTKERWTRLIHVSIVTLVSWSLLVFVFRTQLVVWWTLQPWLGPPTPWPPVPANLLFRWVYWVAFAPALAYLLEVMTPKTPSHPIRVLLPTEKAKMEAVKQMQVVSVLPIGGHMSGESILQKSAPLPSSRTHHETRALQGGRQEEAATGAQAESKQISPPSSSAHTNRTVLAHASTPSQPQEEAYNWDEGEGTVKV